jgi:phage baseplate assembly protein W
MKGISMYGSDFFIIKQDQDLIAESIERLIMTNNNERLKHPFLGADLKRLLFEQADEETTAFIEKQIREQIAIYEPRVNLTKVDIQNDSQNNRFNIHLGFAPVEDVNDERFLELTIVNET